MSEEFENQQEQFQAEPFQTEQPQPSQMEQFQQAQQNNGVVSEPSRKKSGGYKVMDIVATIVAASLFYLFGLLGGLICYGAYWIVRAIVKSKMGVAAKVILSVVVILLFIVLFIVYLIIAAALSA